MGLFGKKTPPLPEQPPQFCTLVIWVTDPEAGLMEYRIKVDETTHESASKRALSHAKHIRTDGLTGVVTRGAHSYFVLYPARCIEKIKVLDADAKDIYISPVTQMKRL